ncbi:hypothetical protein [Streptomyces sp. HUCO-GS316]|uniref:hypothetical protein n=1 Tax=Streptomyces sp. HUCO-GS316 TaxID=2692198 RepID=UPI001F47C640|nr:hypothetical protein [Streptomyces sp. HUCO-GS316]
MTKHRTTPRHAPLPVLRAAVFALVGTVLGMSSHHLVGQGPMPWRQSAAAAAVLFGLGLAGTRRPRSLPAVVAACVAAQAGLHLWLVTERPAGSASTALHVHHGMDVPMAWHDRLHGSLAMTAVHAAAAVLVAVLLHRADTVCWSLARGLPATVDAARARIASVWTLLGERTAAPETGIPGLVRDRWERPPLKGAVLWNVVVRRGPPRADSLTPSDLAGTAVQPPRIPHAWRHPCSMSRASTAQPAA